MKRLLACLSFLTFLLCLPAYGQYTIGQGTQAPRGAGSIPASTPTFSPAGGTYTSTQTVTISASTGGVICYNTTGSPATNGTTGCTTGTLYTGTVSVSATETLYAVAGGTGYTDSTGGSAAYTVSTVCGSIGSPCNYDFSGSTLSANFTVPSGTFSVSGGTVQVTSGGTNYAYYNAGSFTANQKSCVVYNNVGGGSYFGPAVRMQPGGGGYVWAPNNVGNAVQCWPSGCSNIGSNSTVPTVGDTICLGISESTLTLTDITTSTVMITGTDTTFTTGSPGIAGSNNHGIDTAIQSGYGVDQ